MENYGKLRQPVEKLQKKGLVGDQPNDGEETNVLENEAGFIQKAKELKEKLTSENLKNKAKKFLEDKIATKIGKELADSLAGLEGHAELSLIGVLIVNISMFTVGPVLYELGFDSGSSMLMAVLGGLGVSAHVSAKFNRFFESRLASQSSNLEGEDDDQDQLSSQGE